jgi:peptidoglycan/LPS O-acetylase OafA/YrhL
VRHTFPSREEGVAISNHAVVATNSPRQGKNKQIVGLDLLRFCAAMMVMLYHYGFRYWAFQDFTDTNYHYLAPFTYFGFVGVEIFFTLSGFIIAYSASGVTASAFAKGRILRLYPAAWICATLTLGAAFAMHLVRPIQAWLNSLLLSPHGPWIDGTYWTLSVELVFYAIIFALLVTHGFRRIGSVLGAVGLVSTIAWLVSVVPPSLLGSLNDVAHRFDTFMAVSRVAELTMLSYGCFFALGVLLWLCLLRGMTLYRVAGLTICAVGGVLELRVHSALLLPSGNPMPAAMPIFVWLLSLAGIVASVRWNERIHLWIGRRGASIARTLGMLSYPLYLLHQRLGFLFLIRMHGRLPDLASIGFLVFAMPCLAYVVCQWPEKYLRNVLSFVLHGPTRMAMPAATLP